MAFRDLDYIEAKSDSTNAQLGKLTEIFKMKMKCIINVGEAVVQVFVYIHSIPV